jgi:hypothetical protein
VANYLVVAVAPSRAGSAQPDSVPPDPGNAVQLWIGSQGAFLSAGAPDRSSWPGPSEPGQRLDLPEAAGLGALHRWELVFTADDVLVYLDGDRVGSAAYRAPWQRADVSVAAFVASNGPVPLGARVALVGLTGSQPDGRPVQVLELNGYQQQPGGEQRFPVPAAPTAQSARLTAIIVSTGPENGVGPPRPPPEIFADVAGRPVELRRGPSTYPGDPSVWLSAELPVQALASDTTVAMRSADGAEFGAFEVQLELTHAVGTPVDAQQPRVDRPNQPALAEPRLAVRSGQRIVTGSDPAPRGKLDVDITVDSLSAQAVGLAGWVALRVELDGRRILDFPTATDGPAAAGTYHFALDTTDLANGYYPLVVTLIPDRPGVAPTTDRMTLYLTN